MVDHMPERSADGAREHFDRCATQYDNDMAASGYSLPSKVAQVLSQCGIGHGALVLDVGCGTGLGGVALRDAGIARGGTIWGVDISDNCLDEALMTGAYSKLVLHNVEETLPFDSELFDAVIAIGVTEFVEDFEHFFAEMSRVAKAGGICCWTHRESLWQSDDRHCVRAVRSMEEAKRWKQMRMLPAETSMPARPVAPEEQGRPSNQSRAFAPELVFVHRRIPQAETERLLKEEARESARKKREESLLSREQTRAPQQFHEHDDDRHQGMDALEMKSD